MSETAATRILDRQHLELSDAPGDITQDDGLAWEVASYRACRANGRRPVGPRRTPSPVGGPGPAWPPPEIPPDQLEALALWFASFAAEDAPPAVGDGADRAYTRLAATASYEAWLIVWSPMATLELHDHGGSKGAVHVTQGELVETYTDLVDRHPLRTRVIGPGTSLVVPSRRVHAVRNLGPEAAVSVHVYSPPLTAMTFFDHDPRRFLTPLRTERTDSPSA